jgi:hypothetical protein
VRQSFLLIRSRGDLGLLVREELLAALDADIALIRVERIKFPLKYLVLDLSPEQIRSR